MAVRSQPPSQFAGRHKHLHAAIVAAGFLMLADQAAASELVYQPTNPAFGGNPFNGPFLIETAKIQNGHEAKTKRIPPSGLGSGIAGSSDQQQFVRILQSRLLSDMASKVADGIFGESAKDSGEFRYGSQVVSFSRGIDSISIDIFNEQTGERTQISVPSSVQ